MLSSLGACGPTDEGPMTIHADNKGSIKLAHKVATTKRTKHIDIQYHFTRSLIENGEVRLEYCLTSKMMADMMTKALSRAKIGACAEMAGLLDLSGQKQNSLREREGVETCRHGCVSYSHSCDMIKYCFKCVGNILDMYSLKRRQSCHYVIWDRIRSSRWQL
jgi:hypothetical protein